MIKVIERLAREQVAHRACRRHRDRRVKSEWDDKYVCSCCGSKDNYYLEHMRHIDYYRMDKMSELRSVWITPPFLAAVGQASGYSYKPAITADRDGPRYFVNDLCWECAERVKNIYTAAMDYPATFETIAGSRLGLMLLPELASIILDYARQTETRECVRCIKL